MTGPLHELGIWSLPILLGGLTGAGLVAAGDEDQGKRALPVVLLGVLIGLAVLALIFVDSLDSLDMSLLYHDDPRPSGAAIVIDEAIVSQIPYTNLLFTVAISLVLVAADAGNWYGLIRLPCLVTALVNFLYLGGKAWFEILAWLKLVF